jgi:hypothetical protein
MNATPVISPKLTGPVWRAFRRHCHRFLVIGYREALTRIGTGPDEETDITGYICEALENWFRRNATESVGFFIKDDSPVVWNIATGKRRPRTDIIFSYAAGSRPEFVIEAKRLHRQKAVAARYVAASGVGCFVSAKYASGYLEAAMLGYVQTDTSEWWRSELERRVREGADQLKLKDVETRVNFKDALPLEWASFHHRDGLQAMTVFHLLLDCRKAAKQNEARQ